MYGASSASAASAFALLNRGFSERLPSTVRKVLRSCEREANTGFRRAGGGGERLASLPKRVLSVVRIGEASRERRPGRDSCRRPETPHRATIGNRTEQIGRRFL